VASQTKVFVAAAVLQLVAGGRVGLDDPVGSYLPRRLLPEGGESSCSAA
jgi:D-alanyl-D-alanine carboxypeptidase